MGAMGQWFLVGRTFSFLGVGGAVAGIVGAYFVAHPGSKLQYWLFDSLHSARSSFVLALFFGFQLLFAFLSPDRMIYIGNTVGFLTGALFMFTVCRFRGKKIIPSL